MRALTFAVALAIGLTGCDKWSDSNVEQTKQCGDVVVAALKRFRDRTGAYPARLEQLIPQELQQIPQPTVGKRQWEYETWPTKDERGYFGLKVAIRSQSEPLLQTQSDGDWSYDTK